MIIFDELIALCGKDKTQPFCLQRSRHHPGHAGLHMVHRHLPVSISEVECNYLHDFIVKHQLQRGFDLATGFGVSVLAMATAMKQTGGHVISMDSYEEEFTQIQPVGVSAAFSYAGDGYHLARWLLSKHGLDEFATVGLGMSPSDIPNSILNRFASKGVDVVFLDCPKSDPDFVRDLIALKPFLSDDYAILVHDTHTMMHPSEMTKAILGREMVNVLPDQTFPLMCVSNLPGVRG